MTLAVFAGTQNRPQASIMGRRLLAKAVAAGKDTRGCLQAASGIVVRILWSTYQRKRLELAGLNLGEDQEFKFTSEDYADRYQAEVGKNKQQAEEDASKFGARTRKHTT